MTPELTTEQPVILLERTREDLYRIADRAPALSRRLSTATRSITEVLASLGEPAFDARVLHERLLAVANSVAAARNDVVANQELQLQLAHAFGVLAETRQQLTAARPSGPARHLRLIHSS